MNQTDHGHHNIFTNRDLNVLPNFLPVLLPAVKPDLSLKVSLEVLLDFIAKQPVPTNLQYVLKRFLGNKTNKDKEYNRLYMRLYRLLKRLEREGIVQLQKMDGLIVVKPTPKLVDLIRQYVKFKPRVKPTRKCKIAVVGGVKPKKPEVVKPVFPVRMNWFRFQALKFLSKKKFLGRDDWFDLGYLFASYLDDVDKKVLVFKNEDNEFMLLPYNHRFRRLRQLVKKYAYVWNYLSNRNFEGVFMTFTIDPKNYDSVLDANKNVGKAFNRFMSWLQKRLGYRPQYIAVREFTDKGYMHLHVVFFGVSRLADKFTELTPELVRVGFGKISYLYVIQKTHNTWVWKNKPSDAKNDPKRYLLKYLMKALINSDDFAAAVDSPLVQVDDMKVSMYWALGTRFFTFSRVVPVFSYYIYRYKIKKWVFVGAFDWLHEYVEYAFYRAVYVSPLLGSSLGPPLGF